jgi:hypothetical protein
MAGRHFPFDQRIARGGYEVLRFQSSTICLVFASRLAVPS